MVFVFTYALQWSTTLAKGGNASNCLTIPLYPMFPSISMYFLRQEYSVSSMIDSFHAVLHRKYILLLYRKFENYLFLWLAINISNNFESVLEPNTQNKVKQNLKGIKCAIDVRNTTSNRVIANTVLY